MASASEIHRLFPASPSASEAIAKFPSQMMGLVRSSPALPLEPPDPPDPPARPPATSPPQSEVTALLLLLSRSSHLDLYGTRSRSPYCSRSLKGLSTECCSLRPWARDAVAQPHAQRLMCPSPFPLPRSDVNSLGP
ncbi:unnamed protein product [Arabis nemorensis]|uniref:Uncharacterized protein n=1 Tax=Arabis nemorensis TaxID=586526 RepID=A0A565ARX0_9BRAS|nr:unnamed protein product [Arabis nemorensis]